MTIQHFFDNTITIRRLKTVSGNKRSYVATATADCHFQDMDVEARKVAGIVEDRAWIGWFSSDIDYIPQIGDHVTDHTGKIYKVIDVTNKDYTFGINQHIEIVMVDYYE